ncbi:MAG: hypothetical protein ACXWL2_01915 [Candidatus Chromulinivorax sp.]
MNDQIKVLIDNLQNIINAIHNTPARIGRFTLVYEYCILLFTNLQFEPCLKTIFQQGQQAQAKLEPYKVNALQELQQKTQMIAKFMNKYAIHDSQIIECIEQFYILLKKHNQQFHEELFFPIEHALNFLLNSNNNKVDIPIMEKTFGTITQAGYDKSILQKIAFPQFTAWRNAQFAFDDKKAMAPWFSLQQLIGFLRLRDFQIHDKICDELKQKNIDTTDFEAESLNLLKCISSNNQKDTKLFPTPEQYQNHMRILLDTVRMQVIAEKEAQIVNIKATDPLIKYKITFNKTTGLFSVNNGKPPIQFKKKYDSFLFLQQFVDEDGIFQTNIVTDQEAYNIIVKKNKTVKTPDIYEIYRHIKDRLATELGLVDFFLRPEENASSINSIYFT